MSAPSPRKTGVPAPPSEPGTDILAILVWRKVLTPEQGDRVRRATKVNSLAA